MSAFFTSYILSGEIIHFLRRNRGYEEIGVGVRVVFDDSLSGVGGIRRQFCGRMASLRKRTSLERRTKIMARTKKFLLVSCAATSLMIAGAVVAWAHGGEHHAEPGYGRGHDSVLNNNFHHYDHQNHYGTDKNVWCNGSGQQLSPHHGGGTVRADLPDGSSFVGGFCIKANLSEETVLNVNYKDIAPHDKVWLKAEDSAYYPIDRTPGETSIQIEDGGWADRNSLPGQVEAEVLFSAASSGGNPGGSTDRNPANASQSGGGGCSLAGAGSWVGAAFLFVIPSFFLRKPRGKNSLSDGTEAQ
jgi:hypothetical protein